ncbi:MAG: cyclic nucleotide-binding domain-containing protein, partial [Nitrospirota bacterium]
NNLLDLIYSLKDEMQICRSLADDEIQKAMPCFELVNYNAGTVIFNEGDPGDFMGFVVSGKLEVKKETDFKGKQIILALLGKGSFVGELSAFDSLPRSATVVAAEDSQLMLLKRETFLALIHNHPQIAIKILQGIIRVLALRLRKTTERLTTIF